jgi:nucleoside-diphosphate-sugar epimerase
MPDHRFYEPKGTEFFGANWMEKHEHTSESGRVLVTGACGFVGAHVLQYLRKESCNVVGTSRTANIAEVRACNLVDHEQVDHLFQEDGPFSSIVHIAGNARANGCNDFYECMKNNVAATAILAGSAAKHGVSRFIYCSTLSVNGLSDTTLFDDLSAANPQNVYATSKWLGEEIVARLAVLQQLTCWILRPSNIVGPGMNSMHALAQFMVSAATPEELVILGDGSHRRQWLDVRDFCQAVKLCLEMNLQPGSCLKIPLAPQESYSMNDLAALLRCYFSEARILRTGVAGQCFQSQLASTKPAEQILGFCAQYSLKDSLEFIMSRR